MKILFVDDDIERHRTFRNCFAIDHHITHTFDTDETKYMVQYGNDFFDVICLDRDLNDFEWCGGDRFREYTGEDIARYMRDYSPHVILPHIVIHSMNSVGAAAIASILEDTFPTILLPFNLLIRDQRWLEKIAKERK